MIHVSTPGVTTLGRIVHLCDFSHNLRSGDYCNVGRFHRPRDEIAKRWVELPVDPCVSQVRYMPGDWSIPIPTHR